MKVSIYSYDSFILKKPNSEVLIAGANPTRADLTDAYLILTDANLIDTNLAKADPYKANLTEAKLEEANLKVTQNLIVDQFPKQKHFTMRD